MVKEVKDYVDKVQEEFPIFTKQEITKILSYGLKQYAWVNKMHADVLLMINGKQKSIAHCGMLGYDSLKHYWRFLTKNRMKERALFKLRHEEWDGYYYIGLTQEQHEGLKKHKKYITFKNVFLTKLKKELYHLPFVKHIWRIPYLDDCGWRFFKTTVKSDKAEYLGNNKYERYHKYLLGRSSEGYASSDSDSANTQ